MAIIILKPSKKCNSNCVYCYVDKKNDSETMPLNLLEHIFIKINEFLKTNTKENVLIVWHGGEPLLLGENYFISALKFQEKHCKKTKHRIKHTLQTNLTLLNEKYLEIFRKMGIKHLGTSFEPSVNVRGFGKNHDSYTYNKNFLKSINLLEKKSFGWEFIYVVNKKSLERPLDLFFFLSNLKLRGFRINPVVINGEDKENIDISPDEYADFLGAIFPVWWNYRERYPYVNPFTVLVEAIIEKKQTNGWGDTGSCIYDHLYIDSIGETSHCSRSGEWNMISYGNIMEHSIHDILQNKQREQFVKRINSLLEGECKNCKSWEYCKGGCFLESYIKHKDYKHKTFRCEERKIFLEKYFIPITGVKL